MKFHVYMKFNTFMMQYIVVENVEFQYSVVEFQYSVVEIQYMVVEFQYIVAEIQYSVVDIQYIVVRFHKFSIPVPISQLHSH